MAHLHLCSPSPLPRENNFLGADAYWSGAWFCASTIKMYVHKWCTILFCLFWVYMNRIHCMQIFQNCCYHIPCFWLLIQINLTHLVHFFNFLTCIHSLAINISYIYIYEFVWCRYLDEEVLCWKCDVYLCCTTNHFWIEAITYLCS